MTEQFRAWLIPEIAWPKSFGPSPPAPPAGTGPGWWVSLLPFHLSVPQARGHAGLSLHLTVRHSKRMPCSFHPTCPVPRECRSWMLSEVEARWGCLAGAFSSCSQTETSHNIQQEDIGPSTSACHGAHPCLLGCPACSCRCKSGN